MRTYTLTEDQLWEMVGRQRREAIQAVASAFVRFGWDAAKNGMDLPEVTIDWDESVSVRSPGIATPHQT
jgi:hypothetical protein